MVPLPSPVVSLFESWTGILNSRTLGERPEITSSSFNDQQSFALQVLALTFSSISVASSLLAFYWFRRMRRSFRHDLIMFLIQSDMFKALWFMVYPIVVFTNGPVDGGSVFCKVNGFFISLGIEASDFAVLMIAIHSALYIFNAGSRTAIGEGGLYPYRRIAFVMWIVFPLLMASLAFINDQNAYTALGTYCYLPVRPFWYRLALSWIPRYIIFVTIGFIYVAIYFYVEYKFRGFVRESFSGPGGAVSDPAGHNPNFRVAPIRFSLPQAPRLTYNGGVAESRHNSVPDVRGRKPSDSSAESWMMTTKRPQRSVTGPTQTVWGKMRCDLRRSLSGAVTAPDPFAEALDLAEVSPDYPQNSNTLLSIPSEATAWAGLADDSHSQRESDRNQSSFMRLLCFLRLRHEYPAIPSDDSLPMSDLQLVNSFGQSIALTEVVKTRDKIRRQLRFLFIYPIVYMCMWILPFVSHVLQYQDKFVQDPPYGLSVLVIISLVSQGAVDCWLFSTREKPWRHIPGSKGGFWESFAWWRQGPSVGGSKQRKTGKMGKSRMEMVTEARMAYQRRDEEIAAMREERNSWPVERQPRTRRGSMSWWDELETGRRAGDGNTSLFDDEIGPTDMPAAVLPRVREESGTDEQTFALDVWSRSRSRRGSRAVTVVAADDSPV